MPFPIPDFLTRACHGSPDAAAWLGRLPDTLRELERRWALTIGAPLGEADATCAWVAPVTREDGSPAILKLGMPHFEGDHEIQGLQFWDGDPTVRVLAADPERNGMLLERCEPGTPLRWAPDEEQDVVIAGLHRRLWRPPEPESPFRPLSAMLDAWAAEARAAPARGSDPGLLREGLRLFDELPRTAPEAVVLATDLHAGNVLRAQREPWLVIDPKPFVGDPAYDATQHLLNGLPRLRADPDRTVQSFADRLGVDPGRVRLWLFARLVAGPRGDEQTAEWERLARRLAV